MFGFFNPSTIINPSFCNSRYLDWQAHFWDSSSRYWMSAVPMMNNCFSTFGFGMPHPADTMMRYNQTGPNFSSPLFGNNWNFMGWNGSTLGASTSNQSTDSSTSDENKQYKNLRALLNKIKENEVLSDDDRETIQQALDEANGAGSAEDKLGILQDAYEKISNDSVKLSVVIEEEKNNLLKAGYELDNTKAGENVKKFKEEIDSLTRSNYDTINAKNLIRGTNIIDFISSWNDSNETDIITYLEDRKKTTEDTNIKDEIDKVIKLISDELIKEAKKLRSELKEDDYKTISIPLDDVGKPTAETITLIYSVVRKAKRDILEYELNQKYGKDTNIASTISVTLDGDLESELKKICKTNDWKYDIYDFSWFNFTHKDAKVEKAEETATGVVADGGGEEEGIEEPPKDPKEEKIEDYDKFFKNLTDQEIQLAKDYGMEVFEDLSDYTFDDQEIHAYNIIMNKDIVREDNVFAFLYGYNERVNGSYEPFFEQLSRECDFDPSLSEDNPRKNNEKTTDIQDCLKRVLACMIANLKVVDVKYQSELKKEIENNKVKKPAEVKQLENKQKLVNNIIDKLENIYKEGKIDISISDCKNIDKMVSQLFSDKHIAPLLKLQRVQSIFANTSSFGSIKG